MKRAMVDSTGRTPYPPKTELPYFHKDLARMARFANLAYCLKKKKLMLHFGGFKAHAFIDRGPDGYDIIVTFWAPMITLKELQNGIYKMKPYKYLLNWTKPDVPLVESSWKVNFDPAFQKIILKIKSLMDVVFKRSNGIDYYEKSINVKFVGHSIGGVYALLAALQFKLLKIYDMEKYGMETIWGSAVISAITFGQPRIGDSAFAKMINQFLMNTIYRVTHTNDFFPHYPVLDQNGVKFQHHEVEHWIAWPVCDCVGNGASYYPLYQCDNFLMNLDEFWDRTAEHPECNAAQIYSEPESVMAHNGLYFGIEMGNCALNMDGIYPRLLSRPANSLLKYD
ncbi:hypothetical protein G9A89_014337 [Geosiphon pyriformis]|nr:hypothetical protein G9A89_014337 [Geosiphon pyriformis]